MNVANLKSISVYGKNFMHMLRLPASADRWEIAEEKFGPVKFIAVDVHGGVIEIHSYAPSEWLKYEARDR